jgi:hypothetical protein
VAELLSLKNDGWLEQDEQPLSADEFRKRLELSGVTLNVDGTAEIWFTADDMFTDHGVSVQLDAEGCPVSANIA